MSSNPCSDIVYDENIVYCNDMSWREYVFNDRIHGGKILSILLNKFINREKTILFGLVAGGVPVAYSVAKELGINFDVVVVKKITYPWTTEAGFGAVAIDGSYVYDEYIACYYLGYTGKVLKEVVSKVHEYVVERTRRIRGSIEYRIRRNYEVVIVDDGIATGYTMLASIRFLKKIGASKIYVATPTSSSDGAKMVSKEADKVFIVNLRHPPYAVADAYNLWYDLTDEDVIEIIRRAQSEGLYKLYA